MFIHAMASKRKKKKGRYGPLGVRKKPKFWLKYVITGGALLLLVLAGILAGYGFKPSKITYNGRVFTVSQVLDTESFRVAEIPEKIRILGIEGPDGAKGEFRAQEALGFLKEQLVGKKIRVYEDKKAGRRDREGRLQLYVHILKGEELSKLMLRKGYGRVCRDLTFTEKDYFLTHEAVARKKGLGIWDEKARKAWEKTSAPGNTTGTSPGE